MKLTIVLLTVALIQVQAAVKAQTVTLSGKNLPVKKLFQLIKQQTGYVTFYNQEMLADAKPVSVDVNGMQLNELLNLVVKDQPFRFEIKETTKTIVLSPKPVTPGITPVSEAVFQVISGRVTDSTDGAPMPGATVRVQGKNRNASTDAQGRFQVEADPGDILVVSYVGYRPATFTIMNGGKTINIVLAPSISTINNVVVTGIFNKAKESYTGAAKVITAKELQRFQGRNIFVTIGNIDPSFYLVPDNSMGSDPNRLPDIQLRGTRNLPNIDQLQDNTSAAINTPLIILDGFPTSLQRMMDLNNNEIESITLLKDGSATALYGSRGANGVIVITTRQPVGGKLRLTYRGGLNLSMPDLSSYHLLNARDKLELERLSGYYANPTKDANANLGMQQYYNQIKELVESGVNTDWMAKPLRTETDHNHSLRLEGGDNAFRYSLEGQYNKINGVMKGSGRETVNGTVDLSYRLGKLNFRNTLKIGNMKSNESPWGSFGDYVKLNPYWTPYDDQGRLVQFFSPFNWDYWTQGQQNGTTAYPNPMYDATLNSFNKSQYTEITNNFQIEWTPVNHLLLRGGAGLTTNTNTADNFKPAAHSSFAGYSDADLTRKGSYDYASGKTLNYTANVAAIYNNLFAGVHGLTINVAADLTEEKASTYFFSAEGFPDASIDFIGMALQYKSGASPDGREATARRIGALANLNYVYDERYFADLAYRVDGASQFGTNRRFAPFWSAGIGWNLHYESFIKDNFEFINRMRLRGSYGVTGNQQFAAYQPLATYGYITNDRYKTWLGAIQTSLGNPDLQWQKTGKYNAGLEVELFRSRLILQADVYRENTSNLLSSLELPYSNGFTDYIENIGKLKQVGWEMMASVMLIRNDQRRINWSVTGNIAYNRDEIVQLSQAMRAANDKLANVTSFSTPNKIIRQGASQNTIYAVPSLGIDPSTGKELFLNSKGEVTYSWNAADRVAVGLSQPKYRGNFSTLFRYGGLAVNASFGFRFGGQIYNQTLIDKIENANRFFNVDERVFTDRWQKPGDKAAFRGLNETLRIYPSSRFVQDESTLTCQNVNLSYDVVNRAWLQHIGMKSLTFTANTGELFYLSTVRQERGLDYPFTRQVSMSVFATF